MIKKIEEKKIIGRCDCGYETEIKCGPEIPKKVTLLRWNWCPECMETERGNQEWVERFSYLRKPRPKNTQLELL